MQLVLVDDEDGEIVKEFALPESVVNSLAYRDNDIIVEYIGWCTRWGLLSATTDPQIVMTEDQNDSRDNQAGMLNIALKIDVYDPTNDGFLPYMTRKERVEKGLCK
jgi:hypothetical protein